VYFSFLSTLAQSDDNRVGAAERHFLE
jgi:hypothetical protein